MPKKPVRIPAARKGGQGVRWTLQVSADAGEDTSRTRSGGRKRTPRVAAPKNAAPRKPSVEPARPRRVRARKPRPAAAPGRQLPREQAIVPAPAAPDPHAIQAASAPAQGRTSLTLTPRALVIVACAVLVLGALAFTRDPGRRLSATVSAGPAATPPAVNETAAAPERTSPPAAVAAAVAAPARVQAGTPAVEPAKRVTAATPIAAKSVVAATVPAAPVEPPPATALAPGAAPEPLPRTAAVDEPGPELLAQAPVTITGCLESTTDGAQFRLTDTDGADAPKARGWRSGFLKKRPAPVALIEPPDPSALRQLVGYRVVATGQLQSRDLRVRSLASAGPLCDR